MQSLVTTQWLEDNLGATGLVVLDASAHLPAAQRDPSHEYAQGHIPGARFLDLKALTDPDDPVPSAPPTRAQFDAHMSALGLPENARIALYDNSPMRTAARAWFLLRMYGVKAMVLDGGLEKWRAEDRPIETGEIPYHPRPFASAGGTETSSLRYKQGVLSNIDTKSEQVVDARDAARFCGDAPDIRAGTATGHIPGSRNLPFGYVLNPDGTFKDADGIRAAFESAGVDLDRAIVASCGSGITASVLLFALHLIGKEGALYDGSWSEWGADPALPVATGEPA
ncbi:sulfurtransferase [Aurantiacibacter marinus]|uniref:3-mercaptopyruvate sulfurtransferase n=1 Tax=Aurantiacibacter marinus TaxID=874156 RepID=A0A0H0XNK3_9SPHN|nr:sulfurtransferase [Aurantiacibacter marinus]KLI64198.1 3-mercaptopyruvate sulfurtransferase [Aurantiacibacter marinus]